MKEKFKNIILTLLILGSTFGVSIWFMYGKSHPHCPYCDKYLNIDIPGRGNTQCDSTLYRGYECPYCKSDLTLKNVVWK